MKPGNTRGRKGFRRHFARVVIADAPYVAMFALAVTVAIAAAIYSDSAALSRETAKARKDTERTLAVVTAKFMQEMHEHALVAQAMAAAISRNPLLSQAEYEKLAKRVIRGDEDDILNVALAEKNVITHVFPYERNAKALGADLTLVHAQLPGLNLAKRTRMLTASGPFNLVQGGRGLIMRAPVLVTEADAQKEKYWGTVSVVVDLDKMVELEGISEAAVGYDIALRKIDRAGQPGQMVFGPKRVFDSNPERTPLRFPYGAFELAAIPAGGWPVAATGEEATWTKIGAVFAAFSLLLYFVRHLSFQRDLARRRLLQAINSIRDGFIMYDENDRLILCNERYREMFGFDEKLTAPGRHRKELVADALQRGVFPEARGREDEWFQKKTLAAEEQQPHSEHKMANGRWVRFADTRTVDGCLVGLRSDVTELKEATIRAEEANRTKSEFLSTVSHELRTPITSIMGGLGLVLSGKLGDVPASFQSLLKIAHDNCNRLVQLVSEILDLQKIESGRLDFNCDAEAPVDLVSQAIEANRSYAARLNVTYELRVPDDFDARILVDRFRFQQIMDNLLSNAAKFSNPGGTVIVSVGMTGKNVRVSVRDFGRGIAPSDADKLFEPFSQVDSSDTREKGGTGLGLAICKRLVEGMSGTISFESAPGEGAEFFVEFPCLASGSDDDSARADQGLKEEGAGRNPEDGKIAAVA